MNLMCIEPRSAAEPQEAALMRVLTIEENGVDFLLIKHALGEAFSISRALTLAQGLEMAGHDEFDLIILNLTLEDSCGYETFAKVRASQPTIPIVVLSGIDDEKQALRAVANGAQDHIRKSSLINYPVDRAVRCAIESRRVEEAVRKIKRKARMPIKNLPMEQLLGVVGHDLFAPLAALRATVGEFLINNSGKNRIESELFLREMSQEVERMAHTVDDLLDTVRLNSVRAKWNWSNFDLAETADAAISSITPLIDSKRVRILRQPNGGDSRMSGDADAIYRLLLNLLSNARAHTERGQIQVLARKFEDYRGDWVELSVLDSGCGIAAEQVARLGEAFAQKSIVVDNSYASGTGLGLAICNGIAVAHGGELLINSVPGKGTMVTARLRADLRVAASGDALFSNPVTPLAA